MESRKTTKEDGDERTAENVVRLPRDWLGPREELVPMGSRARTAAPTDDAPADSLPPTAASFWDEDSGSLQAPMRAPADGWRGEREPGAAQPAPPTSARRRRIPRPRLPVPPRSGFAPRPSSMAAIIGVLAACVVAVLAAIGQTEGGAGNAGVTKSSAVKSPRIITAAGSNLARLRATPVVTQTTAEPISHPSTTVAARRAHRHRTHISKLRHRDTRTAPRPTQSTSQPAHTTAPAYTPAPTTTPTTPTSSGTSSSPPASTDRSTTSNAQPQPAFGSNGSLGPGSSRDS